MFVHDNRSTSQNKNWENVLWTFVFQTVQSGTVFTLFYTRLQSAKQPTSNVNFYSIKHCKFNLRFFCCLVYIAYDTLYYSREAIRKVTYLCQTRPMYFSISSLTVFPLKVSLWNNVQACLWQGMQALNFALEGAQQFSPGKGHFYEENVNLYLNFAKGITAKAQGTHGNCCGCRGLI